MELTDKDYTDLHVHSSFSLLDGTADPEQLLQATKNLGRSEMAITDHGSVDGWLRFQKAAKKLDVKPLFGCELFMLEHFEEDTEDKQRNLHLSAIAKTPQGVGKLVQALGYANMNGVRKSGRAARPFLPLDYPIANNWGGDVVIMTGCASSPFWNVQGGDDLLKFYADHFKSDLYAEIMPIHDWVDKTVPVGMPGHLVQGRINQLALDAAQKYGLKPVVTSDIHYLTEQDTEFHEVILGIGQQYMTWNNPKRWKFETHCSFVHTVARLQESLFKMGLPDEIIRAAIRNTREVGEKCVHKIEQPTIKLPPVIGDLSPEAENEVFLKLIMEGLQRRGVAHLPGYLERVAYEYDIIAPKRFVRYMLMVWDVVLWARNHGVLIGPSRGSAGGSLISYALGITDIDPILHRLSFERFLAPDRTNMPDIDIDIEDRNRHLVEQYLKEKYGQYNVAHVSTFSSMLGKTALKDVGRLFEVPLNETQQMCNCLEKVHESDAAAHETIKNAIQSGNPDAKAYAEKYPHVVQHAAKLEGQVRGNGIHAAGYIVSPDDLRTSPRAHLINRRDNVTINWDKDDAESMGFVKLDLLGISTLSVVSEALRLIEQRQGVKVVMPSIPLDDAKTYAMLQAGHNATVFQLHTPGTMKFCRQLQPANFEHIAAIPALWKPGPIQAGMTDRYREVRHGRQAPKYLNDIHKKITEITNGEIIYQEQITQLCIELAGYTYAEADEVRKIISKQQGAAKLAACCDKFVAGCKKTNTLDEATAREMWKSLELFGIYCLNRAHSVGYGMFAYWCAYLKANYPGEWICAYLNYGNANKEDDKTGELNRDVALREALRLGIEIVPPDINNSQVIWGVETNRYGRPALRAGLQDIKYIGDHAREAIEKLKAQMTRVDSIEHFLENIDRRACNSKVIKALIYCGAFDSLLPEDERERWIKQFDEMYASYDMPKKRIELLMQPAPNLDMEDIVIRERKIYLRFDPHAIEGSNSAEKMAAIIGGVVDMDADEPMIRRGDKSWTVADAAMGLMPGANGVLKENDSDIIDLAKAVVRCTGCDLRLSCKKPIAPTRGMVRAMIVSETPSWYEEKNNQLLCGDVGEIFWPRLYTAGLQRSDVHVTSVVKCCAPKKTKATPEQIDGCLFLAEEIKRTKPLCILAMGNASLFYFTGKEKGIMEMNAHTEWSSKANAWVTFCIAPSNLCYAKEEGEYEQRSGMLNAALKEFSRCLSQFA